MQLVRIEPEPQVLTLINHRHKAPAVLIIPYMRCLHDPLVEEAHST